MLAGETAPANPAVGADDLAGADAVLTVARQQAALGPQATSAEHALAG
jgi:hypothetical protein